MTLKPCGPAVERLNGGAPIIAPTENWWESGVTFNTAAVYLDRSPVNDPLIRNLLGEDIPLDDPRLIDGVVALHYRARPKHDHGYKWNRSFVGLALFTPGLTTLLKRFPEPLILPGERPTDSDFLGVEDPRITRFGDTFYAVYCGAADYPAGSNWKADICFARSCDLLRWEKMGAVTGDVNRASNKDGVLFPGPIDGQYFLLHRPMLGNLSDFSVCLAASDSLAGPWRDHGSILRSRGYPDCRDSWLGAGAVPIPLGGSRYLEIFHTGNFLTTGEKIYHLDAAIFDFSRFSPSDPSTIVESRLDRFMVPETDWEIKAPFSDSVSNVVFACGAYEYGPHIYIIYGGGDTYIMAARVERQSLLEHLGAEEQASRPIEGIPAAAGAPA